MKKKSLTFQFLSGIIVFTVLLVVTLAAISVVSASRSQRIQADKFISLLKAEQLNQEKLLNNTLLEKIEALADLLAKSAVEPMSAYDIDTLEKLIRETKSDKDIVNVIFFNPDQSPFVGIKTKTDKFKSVKKEISSVDTGPIGFIELTYDLTSVVNNTAQLEKRIKTLLIKAEDSISHSKNTMLKNIIFFSIAGIVLFCFVVYWGVRHVVVKPINRTVAILKHIAKGNLTEHLASEKSKELEELVRWINESAKNTQMIIKNLKIVSRDLSDSSNSLATISRQTQSVTEDASNNSNSVALSTGDLSTNMNSVVIATDQVSGNMSIIGASTEEMTSTISEIAQNSESAIRIIGKAVDQSKNTSGKVDDLGNAAIEISNVTETISDISAQTNLLALNATIEASRAGEAGKGFAVVAKEIKDLARQTSDATIEINNKISGIQTSTASAVKEIGEIFRVIDDVNDIVSTIAAAVVEQSITSKEIAENVSQAVLGIDDVTVNISQSSKASSKIANDISIVDQAAKEISVSSSQVNTKAESLSQMAEQLQKTIGNFQV